MSFPHEPWQLVNKLIEEAEVYRRCGESHTALLLEEAVDRYTRLEEAAKKALAALECFQYRPGGDVRPDFVDLAVEALINALYEGKENGIQD